MDDKKLKEKYTLFFMQNYPKVKAFASKVVKSESDAEDIAQDIFIKLWNEPQIWETEGDSSYNNNFIFKVSKNHIFNFIKHKKIILKHQEQQFNMMSQPLNSDLYGSIYVRELEILINMIVSKMPEQRRNIFTMSRMKYKSNAEISEITGLSIRTVENHIYMALSELKKKISFHSN